MKPVAGSQKKQEAAKIERLRAALDEGEDSGAPAPFDMEKFIGGKNDDRSQFLKCSS